MEFLTMITRRNALVGCAAGISYLLLARQVEAEGAAGEALAVVTSRQSGVSDLSLYQLKRLYLGDTVQVAGRELIALNRDARGAERTGFDESVLGMTPEAAARYWIDRRIRGQSGAPKAIEPAGVIQRVVARLPRAVAYVRAREVGPDVQVVRIDGRTPGDGGYPIHASAGKAMASVLEGVWQF
jgi:hypothetical protein